MAKIETSAADLQWKSNMIKTGASDADWASDSKYPSAKAVTDKLSATASGYPIGSVIMTHKELAASETSSSANPAVLLGLPGNWILIDKAFKNATITFGTDPSLTGSVAGSKTYISSEIITRIDHSLLLQLDIQVRGSSTITAGVGVDPVMLASLPISNSGNYGVTKLSPGIAKNIAFATPDALTASSVICYSIDESGDLWINDILNDGAGSGNATRELKSGTHIYINTVIPIPHTDMIDSVCDKFYWKRIA